MKEPLIFDIQKFCVHDGPGIRTIVFFKGCPLRCQWCANPESQQFEKELLVYPSKCIGCGNCVSLCEKGCIVGTGDICGSADRQNCVQCCNCTNSCYTDARHKSGKIMTIDQIKKEVDKDVVFYKNSGGGITFSGGEPMCFPEWIHDLAKYYKEEQMVSTAIETCCCVPWENYEKVLSYMDLFLCDLKMISDEKHKKFTGASNKQILENIKLLSRQANIVIRIPIIPTINDSKEDIDALGTFIEKELHNVDTIHILPYHNLGIGKYHALGKQYELEDLSPPDDCHMREIGSQLEGYGFDVKIGG